MYAPWLSRNLRLNSLLGTSFAAHKWKPEATKKVKRVQ
jgi:hypothetical protein